MKTKLFLMATFLLGTASMLLAQPQGGPSGGRPRQGQAGQQGQGRYSDSSGGQSSSQRPPLPIVEALDINKDHVIDATELANATANLKKLDKNGDGKLTPDEFMPSRPGGQGGPGSQSGFGGQGGQGGQGGRPSRPSSDQNGRPAPPSQP